MINSILTKCIAPECKDGLVFGEACRACYGSGYIIMRESAFDAMQQGKSASYAEFLDRHCLPYMVITRRRRS